MPDATGSNDLFRYDAKYRVVICRDCKYAVQKSALDSHLLRHKVYRGERKRLLSSIGGLDIQEPDDVQLPGPGSAPVEGLPILSGHRCTATGCNALFATLKRMRRHWSTSHGTPDPPECFASPVSLQTFFRGTKIRYFEVAVHSTPAVPHPVTSADDGGSLNDGFDLEALRYLHHFTTAASLDLLMTDGPVGYWQDAAVARSLQQPWMICGILAISACHLVSASHREREGLRRLHGKRAALYVRAFSDGLAGIVNAHDVARGPDAHLAAQISCILTCCGAMVVPELFSRAGILGMDPFQLSTCSRTLRGCFDPEVALHMLLGDSSAPDRLSERGWTSSLPIPDRAQSRGVPPKLLEHFASLPYRMATAVGKPASAQDFLAIVSALEAVEHCCALSYASDDTTTTWNAMESWITKVPDRFFSMVLSDIPAALVVIAQWTILVARAEPGRWFLKGAAATLRREITARLPQDRGLIDLIEVEEFC